MLRAFVTPPWQRPVRHAPRRLLSVAFFGSDDISLATLTRLHAAYEGAGPHAGLITDLRVVTPGPRPVGRGHGLVHLPVSAFAQAARLCTAHVPYGMKSLKGWSPSWSVPGVDTTPAVLSQPARDASVAVVATPSSEDGGVLPWVADVGVVVSFGYFMTSNVLALCREGAINMHPSLLPKYRGAAPIPYALLNGDNETGVSIINIHPSQFDAGAVLYQQRTAIAPTEGCAALTRRLGDMGAAAVMDTLANLDDRRATAASQPGSATALAPKLQPQQGCIAWPSSSSSSSGASSNAAAQHAWQPTNDAILARARAFDDSFGVYTHCAFGKPAGVKRVRLWEVAELESVLPDASHVTAARGKLPTETARPGELAFLKAERLLCMRTLDGWLVLQSVQLQHKMRVRGVDFANGFHIGVRSGHHFCNEETQQPTQP